MGVEGPPTEQQRHSDRESFDVFNELEACAAH